jgi:hypothetical protein
MMGGLYKRKAGRGRPAEGRRERKLSFDDGVSNLFFSVIVGSDI